MPNNYSKKELKLMLKTKIIPLDAPSWVHKKIDAIRKELNRNAPTNQEIIDEMMEEEARLWMPVKRPNWVNRFKKILGHSTRFAGRLRSLINR